MEVFRYNSYLQVILIEYNEWNPAIAHKIL